MSATPAYVIGGGALGNYLAALCGAPYAIPRVLPIGALSGSGPYAAWMLHADPKRDWPWGVRCAAGFNCFGLDGAVFLPSREAAERVIRSHGSEPEAPVYG